MTVSPSVVVANPGSIPEMHHMAAGFARSGLLRAYVTPVAATSNGRAPWSRLLRRRARPQGVGPAQVRREATLSELAFVASERLHLPTAAARCLLDRRNVWFDERLSRQVQPSDFAVVVTYGAALTTLRRARQLGVASFLEYPIAHHRYAEALLDEEARLRPDFAGTLQYHRFSAQRRERLEQEIAAAARIFVLSGFQKRTFIQSGVPEEKLLVTPLGVDLDLFRPQPRPEDGVFRVIFVGQITQRKGISYLFDAFERAAIPNSELLLVGNIVGTDAPWRNRPRVRHVSHVPRWELPAHYAAADVFVLPSLAEGFPQTALEAMACGKPVIVSENTFGEDVVTDGVDGFVVPIRDADAIADRLRYLHEHPGVRERMGTAARRRAEAFSWERYGERVVELVCLKGGNRVAEETEG